MRFDGVSFGVARSFALGSRVMELLQRAVTVAATCGYLAALLSVLGWIGTALVIEVLYAVRRDRAAKRQRDVLDAWAAARERHEGL